MIAVLLLPIGNAQGPGSAPAGIARVPTANDGRWHAPEGTPGAFARGVPRPSDSRLSRRLAPPPISPVPQRRGHGGLRTVPSRCGWPGPGGQRLASRRQTGRFLDVALGEPGGLPGRALGLVQFGHEPATIPHPVEDGEHARGIGGRRGDSPEHGGRGRDGHWYELPPVTSTGGSGSLPGWRRAARCSRRRARPRCRGCSRAGKHSRLSLSPPHRRRPSRRGRTAP